MSLSVTVHVGPYAELLLPEERAHVAEALGEFMDSVNHNLENPPTVEIDGEKLVRVCFAPFFSRYVPLQPPRQMHWDGGGGPANSNVVDLTDVNVADEVAWFEREFAEFLRAVADAYGQPARVRWGVVPSLG
jgi:hypothetical protein